MPLNITASQWNQSGGGAIEITHGNGLPYPTLSQSGKPPSVFIDGGYAFRNLEMPQQTVLSMELTMPQLRLFTAFLMLCLV
ncbi:hypothetical protein, partial [Pseudomonas sp. GL-RE-19]|uniref:hypothetical protein n=1 Tax=Pseudomonas sp. GL-RE-19 TaxID=2832389 RepID=UPI001CBF2FD5